MSNDELKHYGVIGMKWGIRRYQPYSQGYQGSSGKFTPDSKSYKKAVAAYEKASSGEEKAKAKRKVVKAAAKEYVRRSTAIGSKMTRAYLKPIELSKARAEKKPTPRRVKIALKNSSLAEGISKRDAEYQRRVVAGRANAARRAKALRNAQVSELNADIEASYQKDTIAKYTSSKYNYSISSIPKTTRVPSKKSQLAGLLVYGWPGYAVAGVATAEPIPVKNYRVKYPD